jgi:hypothetical protein
MKRTKSLLKKVVPEIAKHRRTCRNTGEAIPAGSICLVVFDAPRDRHCYSRAVGLRMIQQAREDLQHLEKALGFGVSQIASVAVAGAAETGA